MKNNPILQRMTYLRSSRIIFLVTWSITKHARGIKPRIWTICFQYVSLDVVHVIYLLRYICN